MALWCLAFGVCRVWESYESLLQVLCWLGCPAWVAVSIPAEPFFRILSGLISLFVWLERARDCLAASNDSDASTSSDYSTLLCVCISDVPAERVVGG